MSDIKKWKTPAGSNMGAGFAPPDGFPEGMLRSDVNNSMREIQASVRRMWDDPDWKNPVDGFTVVQGADNTKVNIQATNATGYFNVNQKVRIRSSSSATGYAFVTSVAMVGSDTVVTLEEFDVSGTPTPSTSVPADCNGIDVYFIGGGGTNNHGIGRTAFSGGGSDSFVIPEGATAAGINAAIVIAETNGQTVLLPYGTTTITDPIVITSGSVRITGRNSTIKMADSQNKNIIEISDDVEHVNFESFTIDGNGINQSTSGHGISVGNNVHVLKIIGMIIKNCKGNAISLGGTDTGGGEYYEDIVIRDTRIDQCGNTAILINDPNGTSTDIFISDVNIEQFGDAYDAAISGANACGIDIAGIAQIEGLSINATSSNVNALFAGAAIRLRESSAGGFPPGGSKCQVSNFSVRGNFPGLIGLHVRGSESQISNGHIDLSGTGTVRPIVVEGLGTGTESASDNLLSNIHVTDGTRSEILGTSDRVMLSDCHFTAASEMALLIGGDYTKVFNCSFDGGTSSYSIVKTIVTQAGSDGIEIKGCLLRGTSGDCVTLIGNSHNMNGCTVSDITGNAITLASGTTNCVVMNNVIDGVSGAGITIASGATSGLALMNSCVNVVGENYSNSAGYEGRFECNSPEYSSYARVVTYQQRIRHDNLANNGSTITSWTVPSDLTDLDYPLPPNGSRRFVISVRVAFLAGGNYNNRRFYLEPFSGVTHATSNALRTAVNSPELGTAGTVYLLGYGEIQTQPAVGEQVWVRVAQTNGGAPNSSLLPTTDYGYFDLGNSPVNTIVAEANRGRCFVRIEYLGEENDA